MRMRMLMLMWMLALRFNAYIDVYAVVNMTVDVE